MEQENAKGQPQFTRRPWQSLIVLIAFLIVLAAGYIILHTYIPGSIDSRLSDEDKTVVSLILNDTAKVPDSVKVAGALNYILTSVKLANTEAASDFIKEYASIKPATLLSILPSLSISTKSYFWLNSEKKYLEVIFWSVFGVLASLLYFISEAIRKNNFKEEETPVYLAKVAYAPLITLIIVFSYNLLTGSVSFNSTSLELLVFSFILGFFSGRAIELLNKIKDVILPGKSTPEDELGNITVAGKVQLPPNLSEEAKKVKIVLKSIDGKGKLEETFTDKDGNYLFKNVREGLYEMNAETSTKDATYSAHIQEKNLTKDKKFDVDVLSLIEQKGEEDK